MNSVSSSNSAFGSAVNKVFWNCLNEKGSNIEIVDFFFNGDDTLPL